MRYFLYVSLFFLVSSCKVGTYQKAAKAPAAISDKFPDQSSSYQPHFDKVLYNCVVDGKTPFGKRYHLSGLLFIKQLDEGKRVVFQNQMGITYFDFGWDNSGTFKVHSIMLQMDKAPLIKTLKKDFELLLFNNLSEKSSGLYIMPRYPDKYYLRFELNKGFVYYIFDQQQQLLGIENADDHKKVIVVQTSATSTGSLPDVIHIKHLKANFTIQLEQLKINNLQTTEDAATE